MSNVGVLIFFALIGAFICAKSRAAGGAIVFSLIALVLFITTPAGSGLPGAMSHLFSVVNDSTAPALNGGSTGSAAVG